MTIEKDYATSANRIVLQWVVLGNLQMGPRKVRLTTLLLTTDGGTLCMMSRLEEQLMLEATIISLWPI